MQSKCSCISAGIVRILSMNADKNPDPPSSPSEGSISNEEDKDMYDSCDGDGKEISANLYICLGTSEDAGRSSLENQKG